MSYVKGAAVKTLPLIILKKHYQDGLNRWMDTLSFESYSIFSKSISAKKWYPIKEALIEPTSNFCMLFYNWNFKGAWEMGRFSADFGLKGIYKFFIRLGSPGFLVKKAGEILPSYYKPSSIRILESKSTHAVLEISKFPDLNKIIEFRICGWIERALEICGCKEVKVSLLDCFEDTKSFSKIKAVWKN